MRQPNIKGKWLGAEFIPTFDRFVIIIAFFSQHLIFEKIERILDHSYEKIQRKYPGLLKRILESLRAIPRQYLISSKSPALDRHWVLDVTIHSLLWRVASLEKNYIECHNIMQYMYQISRYSPNPYFHCTAPAKLKPLTDFYEHCPLYIQNTYFSIPWLSTGLNMDYAYALTRKYSLSSIWPLARLLLLSRSLNPLLSPIALIQEELTRTILPLLINRLFHPILVHRPLFVALSCIILKSHDHVLKLVDRVGLFTNVHKVTCSHCKVTTHQVSMVECTDKNCDFKACVDKDCWKQYEENDEVSRNHYDPVYFCDECSYLQTGQDFYLQEYYDCIDCNYQCCVFCSKTCHAGHRLGERKVGDIYCDCGEKATCSSRKKICGSKML